LEIACFFATQEYFDALRTLFDYHTSSIWPSRFALLDHVPLHAHPVDFRDLLPAYNPDAEAESSREDKQWRTDSEWVLRPDVRSVLHTLDFIQETGVDNPVTPSHAQIQYHPLSLLELEDWYKDRVMRIMTSTGLVDVALATIQHGTALAVTGLDELAEELSLFSRLIYDTTQSEDVDDEWTFSQWQRLLPGEVVSAYLSHTTSANVAQDIRHLVMPYLFVLESRAERAGKPDPELPTRLLYQYVLSSPLHILASIMEASKPTLPAAQRLIRNDEDMARLALASLYGSESRGAWPTMSQVFECLPAWDVTSEGDATHDEAEAMPTSFKSSLTLSTANAACSSADLYIFFKPLSISSLSRALDALDVHLEAGEILGRWDISPPLQWFLHHYNDDVEQRSLANKLVRRQGSSRADDKDQQKWESMLVDMFKLTETSESGIRGVFGLLSPREVSSIFFAGLLSAGKFEIARHFLAYQRSRLALEDDAVEDLCLCASREFYDNSNSGNYKFGDMKLAYDCLSVPKTSKRLVAEREFIEATSRLCSFNILSRSGLPITPIEIRLTKDRLSLVSRVLSSNPDSYRHVDVILELLWKLGFRGDVVAEVKTLAMLADTALQAEDFERARELNERMVQTVLNLRAANPSGAGDPVVQQAIEVCWVACFQLGRQPEFDDSDAKLALLGRALELCPPDKLHDVLLSWRRLEKEDVETRRDRLASRTSTARTCKANALSGGLSLQERLRNIQIPSTPLINAEDAVDLASRTFSRVASNFPFSVTGGRHAATPSSSSSDYQGAFDQAQASRMLQKGMGWLLGADE